LHPETNQEQYLGKTMAEININTDTCIMCGKCTQVCPPHIFMQREKKTPIRVFKPERCIDCGHCVDVCPTHSIEHSNIPYEKVHKIDYKDMPTPEQLMNLLHARRSNRTFTDRTIQDSAFEQIIEAGCARILTSGLQPSAEQGIPLLKELVSQAAGRIIIMPGGGVTTENARLIVDQTGCKEIHGSFSAGSGVTSAEAVRYVLSTIGG
jgi:ferredoxin